MREIKVRGWHIPSKTWLTSEECLSIIMLQGRTIAKQADGTDLLDRYDIMQFIGRKDMNGVGIFEGDFLSKDYPYDKSRPTTTETGVVKFIESGFCLWFEDDPDEWHYLQETEINRYYITGNIHDNPEMLEN